MTFSILFSPCGYMTLSNQTANYWTVSGIVCLANLFMHFWKLLHYAVLLFPCLYQKELTTAVSGLYIMITSFVKRVIYVPKSSSSKTWMLIIPTVGKAALQPLKCQSSWCQRKHFTPPLVLLQGLLLREHVFLQVCVGNPWTADVSITDSQVLIFQQHIYSGSAGSLFRNRKTKSSQIQVIVKEAWSTLPLWLSDLW